MVLADMISNCSLSYLLFEERNMFSSYLCHMVFVKGHIAGIHFLCSKIFRLSHFNGSYNLPPKLPW